MKLSFFLVRACALFSLCTVAWAAGSRVTLTGNANLRAKPSMDAEILASLKKGEVLEGTARRVTLPKSTIDDPTEWIEITAPATAKVWIASGLVDITSKRVKAERAHLRAGPGTNFSEVGHVAKGTEVDVSTRLDGWIRIGAPSGAVVGYVAANLTRLEGPGAPSTSSLRDSAKTVATNLPPARMASSATLPHPPRTGLAQTPLPANASRPAVTAGRMAPPVPSIAGRPLVIPPAPPLPPTGAASGTSAAGLAAADPGAVGAASGPVESAPPASVESTPVVATSASVAAEPSIPAPSESGRQAEIVFMTERPRQVVRQGVVGLAISPQAPGRYELGSFRRGEGKLGFLISDDASLDFEKWRGKQVVVQGEEYRDARWRTRSVIKVKSIEAVP